MNKVVSGVAALKLSLWNILWYGWVLLISLVEASSADCVKCLADEGCVYMYTHVYSTDFFISIMYFYGHSSCIVCIVIKQALKSENLASVQASPFIHSGAR